jgi:hypothetical protein
MSILLAATSGDVLRRCLQCRLEAVPASPVQPYKGGSLA